jgi:hypothetical protein
LYCKRNENRIDHIDGGNFTVIIKKFGEEIESDIIKQFEDWLSLTFPSSTYNIVLREDKTLI